MMKDIRNHRNHTSRPAVAGVALTAVSALLLGSAGLAPAWAQEPVSAAAAAEGYYRTAVAGQATAVASQGGAVAVAGQQAGNTYSFTTNFPFGQEQDEATYYQGRIKKLEEYLAAARKKRADAKDEAERTRLDQYIERTEADLKRSQERLKIAEKRAPLYKLVDVKFTDASVQQAARALSEASGVSIEVGEGVPESTRLTVEARRVKLATVLESVAEQASLIIEPTDKGGKVGVRLISPPMLKVNNKEIRAPRSRSPWSAEWGTPPTGRFFFSDLSSLESYGSLAVLSPSLMGDIDQTVREALERARVTAPSAGNSTSRSTTVVRTGDGKSVSLSVNGDTVVVTESGKNDKGEAGIWMTVYQFDKNKKEMVKTSATFHKTPIKEEKK
jgi:hypothetical protein